MIGFLVKWTGVLCVTVLAYIISSKAGAGGINFDIGGTLISLVTIATVVTFFAAAGVSVKS